MRRLFRILLITAAWLAGFALMLCITALVLVQTGWFHRLVLDKMIAAIETATGGKAEIGGYSFDWKSLTARVDNFTLHGKEPADSPPLLYAKSVTATLRIVSILKKKIDLQAVEVAQPRVHLIISAGGETNIPAPRIRRGPRKDAIETILDLAIKKVTIESGLLLLNDREKTPFDIRGENLRVELGYQPAGPRYQGSVAMDPLYFTLGARRPFPISTAINVALEKGRIQFDSTRLALAKSTFQVKGDVTNLAHPEVRFSYAARVDLEEIRRALELGIQPRGFAQVTGKAFYAGSTNFSFDGDLHAARVAVDFGTFHIRDASAVGNMRLDPESLHLTRLQLSTSVNPPSAPPGRMVRVQGRVAAANYGIGTDDLDVRGVALATLGGTFEGTARFHKFQSFQTEGVVSGFEARTLLAIYSPQAVPWDGLISGPVSIEGSLSRLGGIRAAAKATISPARSGAPVHGLVDAKYDSLTETLDLGDSSLVLPATNIQFSGVLGRRLNVHVDSKDLDEILPAAGIATTGPEAVPIHLRNGEAVFTGIVTGKLDAPQIAGHVSAANFTYDRQPFDNFAADVSASPAGVEARNASLARGGLRLQFQGSVGLAGWKTSDSSAVSGTASIANANLADLLAMANQKDVPVSGSLTASTQVAGTIGSPDIASDLHLSKGQIQGEPFDRLDAKVTSRGNTVEVSDGRLAAGARQITASATYNHPARDFASGRVQFQVASNAMPLDQFQFVIKDRPGVKGTVQVSASGAAGVAQKAGKPALQVTELRADVAAKGLALEDRALGDAHVIASTEGQTLRMHLDSNIAGSALTGDGHWQLTGDYPGGAQVQFSSLDFARLRDWLAPPKTPAGATQFAGSAQGKVTIEGPLMQPDLWKASLEIPQFQLQPAGSGKLAARRNALTLRNAEPLRLTLQNDVIRVTSAHFTADQTNISVMGTITPRQRNQLDLQVSGRLELELLQTFDSDVISSGQVETDATVRGTFEKPLLAGKVQLKNANLNYADLPNGLSNANGTVTFSGTRANLQNITGESGGGKIVLSGFAGYGGAESVFRIQLDATGVRVRYPEGVSTVANASLTLSGTSAGSLLAGTVTIQRTGFNPRTDLASVLAKSSEPERTPSAQTGFLSDMQLDVQIQMAPDVTFQSSLAENVQADANLRLRGTALNPALLGRIVITQGQIVFFGTKFTIDQGSVSFYNPVKIEPVLDIDLETKARGVDVILTVSGPLSKLNLTPRSDPPLQFSEIIALLATGNAPSSDPNVAIQQPSVPTQSFQQIGASALLGQALANPVAGRLQHFFGVTKLKIDPSLQGVENNPQARITLEQQVTPDITFTYITNITNSNPQVVRVEWALNKRWSVVALREENGLFGVDFLYKKRFK